MVNASITRWNEKKNKLNKLIAQVDKMRSQCEEISNYMYPAAQYMDGIVVDNKTFDNGVLNQSYDNYESIYNSLEKVKKYANNEITRLNNLISEEQRRLQQEEEAKINKAQALVQD